MDSIIFAKAYNNHIFFWYANYILPPQSSGIINIPKGIDIEFQSENGVLGMGPFPFEGEEDPDIYGDVSSS